MHSRAHGSFGEENGHAFQSSLIENIPLVPLVPLIIVITAAEQVEAHEGHHCDHSHKRNPPISQPKWLVMLLWVPSFDIAPRENPAQGRTQRREEQGSIFSSRLRGGLIILTNRPNFGPDPKVACRAFDQRPRSFLSERHSAAFPNDIDP